jgi:hypothetical protein
LQQVFLAISKNGNSTLFYLRRKVHSREEISLERKLHSFSTAFAIGGWIKMKKKCPKCDKKMYWNYLERRWECRRDRKGCGYVLKQEAQRSL